MTVSFTAWQLELIREARVARLATLNRLGAPHLVPVCYALVDGHFAVAIDEKPKRPVELARVRNVRADSRCSLLIDRYDDDWTRLAWLRIDANADVLPRGDGWPEALARLRERYPQYAAMALEDTQMLMITPRRVASWRWEAEVLSS